ncbi:MAG: hypothetical protein ACRDKT_10645 [Actinomycetota bacterium]
MFVRGLLVASMAASLAVVPSPVAGAGCEDVQVEVYDLKIRPARHVYDLGDTARVAVRVTRTDTGDPAENVDVGLGGSTDRDRWVFDRAVTDERGRARLALELQRKHVPPGWMTLSAYGWKRTVDTTCVAVTEYGYKQRRKAFRVRG